MRTIDILIDANIIKHFKEVISQTNDNMVQLEITIVGVVVSTLINKSIILIMDHSIHMKYIMIIEGQRIVNGQRLRSYALVMNHRYIWIICLTVLFQIR